MKHKVPELDGLRAIAVLAVMTTHLSYQTMLVGGYLGVDLFFVLSGFLITSLLLSEEREGKVDLPNFYIRRVLRILPPMLAAVVMGLALGTASIPAALAVVFFVANFVDFPMGAFVPMWSLSVEEHFYAFWPFLFIVLGRHRLRFAGYAILAVVAIRVVLLSMKVGVYQETYARADSLLLGCAAALAFSRAAPQVSRWVAPVALAIVIAAFAFIPWHSFLMMSFGYTALAAVCAALIVSLLAHQTFVNRMLQWRALQYVGRRSYGLYVYHPPLFIAISRARIEGDPWSYAWTTAAIALASFAVAELSYRTIEAWARGASARYRAQHGGFPALTPRT